MTFSDLVQNKRRRTYVRLMGEIRHALSQALSEEFAIRKLTRKHIADTLDVDKSFVTKKFTGEGNMTLETLADLAYALDRSVHVSLPSRHGTAHTNFVKEPPKTAQPSSTISSPGTMTGSASGSGNSYLFGI